jgi:hypothetical protein
MRGAGTTTNALRTIRDERLLKGKSTVYVCADMHEVRHTLALCADVLGLRVHIATNTASLTDPRRKPVIFLRSLRSDPDVLRAYQSPVVFDHHAAVQMHKLQSHERARWRYLRRSLEQDRV